MPMCKENYIRNGLFNVAFRPDAIGHKEIKVQFQFDYFNLTLI